MSADNYYQHHVFFCCNRRPPGERTCCADKGADRVRDYAKQRVKALGLSGPGKVRINQSGCLDRCEEGPCVVVYQAGVWSTYVDEEDVDEMVEQHVQKGRTGARLRLKDPGGL